MFDFFHPPISLCQNISSYASSCITCGRCSTYVKTVFNFLKSIFIQFCNTKLILWGNHAEWPMTDFCLKYLPSLLLKLTVAKSSLTVHSRSVMVVNFSQTLGVHSTQFPFLCEYFKMVKHPARTEDEWWSPQFLKCEKRMI